MVQLLLVFTSVFENNMRIALSCSLSILYYIWTPYGKWNWNFFHIPPLLFSFHPSVIVISQFSVKSVFGLFFHKQYKYNLLQSQVVWIIFSFCITVCFPTANDYFFFLKKSTFNFKIILDFQESHKDSKEYFYIPSIM